MGSLLQDFRFALRSFRRRPGTTMVLVLTAGVAIGAATATFDLANLVAWRQLPGANSAELVRVYTQHRQPFVGPWGLNPYADLESYEDATSFDAVAAERFVNLTLDRHEKESPEQARAPESVVDAQLVTGNFFELLGIAPGRGRLINPEDDGPSRRAVLVLSDQLWRSQFGTSPEVVGSSVVLNDHELQIVGIAPPSFVGTTTGSRTDLWLPMSWGPVLRDDFLADPSDQNTEIIARLVPDRSISQARDELQNIAEELDRIRPLQGIDRTMTVVPARLTHPIDRRNFAPILRMLLAAVGLLLLLASANISSLLLSRALERSREMGMRVALGTSRLRLVRQLLTESLVLALLSGALGLVLATLARRLFVLWDLESFAADMRFDHRVLILSLATCCVTAILFGLAPALFASRTNPIRQIRADGMSLRRAHVSTFRLLAGLQVAIATVLLVCTGLVTINLWSLHKAELGFDSSGLVRAGFDLRQHGYTPDESLAFMKRLEREVRGLPGVVAVGRSMFLPPMFLDVEARFTLPHDPENVRSARFNIVSDGYFETLGIEKLEGSLFGARTREGPGVIIVNDKLAKQLWPGRDPIGQKLLPSRLSPGDPGPEYEVIGVVESIAQHDLRSGGEPIFYFSLDQRPRQFPGINPRVEGDPAAFVKTLRERAAALDPRVETLALYTHKQLRWEALVVERLQSQSVAMLATVGLLLSILGTFGIMSLIVARKTREIGIRLAIGAQKAQIVGWAMRQSLGLAVAGVGVGLLASIWAVRVLRSWISELPSAQLWIYLFVAVVLLCTSLAATFLPGRRASRLDPTHVLRRE